ncbi:MAG: exosortase/archaeosortase family protein [Hyphomicrobiales bacterium]|jgi:exosortase|nr:exosortase/archaeosortase family protein [Hyphomicrobiales bacterium]
MRNTISKNVPARWAVMNCSTKTQAIAALMVLAAVWMPTFLRLRVAWFENPDYGGLYVVPLFALVSFFREQEGWGALPVRPLPRAWIILSILAVLVSWFSPASPRTSMACLPVALALLVLAIYGWKRLRPILPILMYGLLAVPPPDRLWSELTLLMRFLSLESSQFILHLLPGEPVWVDHFSILLPASAQRLMVEDACSGVRSLLSLTVVGLWLIMDARCRLFWKLILVFFIPPIAHAFNAARIVMSVCLFSAGLDEYAEGEWHRLAGYAAVMAGLGVIMGALRLLERYAPEPSQLLLHGPITPDKSCTKPAPCESRSI